MSTAQAALSLARPKAPWFYWSAELILVGMYVFFALIPGSDLPQVSESAQSSSESWDVGHFVGSMLVATGCYLAITTTRKLASFHARAVYLGFAFCVFLAGATELGQQFSSEHFPSLFDFWIDLLGGILGILVLTMFTRRSQPSRFNQACRITLAVFLFGLMVLSI